MLYTNSGITVFVFWYLHPLWYFLPGLAFFTQFLVGLESRIASGDQRCTKSSVPFICTIKLWSSKFPPPVNARIILQTHSGGQHIFCQISNLWNFGHKICWKNATMACAVAQETTEALATEDNGLALCNVALAHLVWKQCQSDFEKRQYHSTLCSATFNCEVQQQQSTCVWLIETVFPVKAT